VLDYLARHKDRIVTSCELVKAIQGYDLTEVDARPLVRVHIVRLRQKLEDDPEHPRIVLNVRGKGYRFAG
jgi:DNA-binding response OmpR family regulator